MPPTVTCIDCGEKKPQTGYSNKQWDKESEQMCKLCVMWKCHMNDKDNGNNQKHRPKKKIDPTNPKWKVTRCAAAWCKNNVPHSYLKHGFDLCRKCTFTCKECKERVFSSKDVACGMFKGFCIDCTKCPKCKVSRWDYFCGVCGYRE